MANKMIKRHTKISIFIHWFNAVCWIFLLATGLGLIKNPQLQPLGMWWSDLMWGIFGSGEALLTAHVLCGIMWAGVFILYGIIGIKSGLIPFVREIFTFSPLTDLLWLIKKGITMTLGSGVLQRIGTVLEKKGFSKEISEPKIPDQGFYNVGQKLFAIPALLGGIVIGLTGILMFISRIWLTPEQTPWVQWAILIHFIVVGLVFAGLLIHIYMASIAAGERPAFFSMFTGKVPEDYAKHHHRLWFDEVKKQGKG